ncbi:polysaccharide deacetylase family protein [Campylobacter hyointestinalis]|uniref:Polysaccharide deacetylase family protein n=1 Tax=Campylobacter hyointestinalis subsp. hyointestinalis TaxID=91352 RepID=A0A2S5J2N3_CAMHY|nr:polysaccharide deacetylase family protein [Campylobacter hyointestinalis]ANE31779.1 polysaccharide deacetylase [Campylobacter hyointestinalis subsp. hyointestinalis LMG 9260]KEA44084.1 hypothetical protein CR67_06530 [Campylobacter hyointestinalis subsp. hyointestinalis]PPB51457.1 hypothetical protein CDQ67_10165 [Campylobacter hyointestinalis subsp. hyointestinalis]PPB64408.1 hypothetical protein CDQ74_02825 [Campylobacter hyointestinalis subsp. hyointestinalis]PPB72145.1 hypothetical prot
MNIKQKIKSIIGVAYYNAYYRYTKPIGNRILIYHAFGSKLKHDTYGISIDPKIFEKHLIFLYNNYDVLPLNHNTLDNELSKNSVSITIDDGYKDNLIGIEILEKYKIPYTIYIATGFIDKSMYLSKQDLIDISKSALCTLGTHSMNHVHLSTLPKNKQFNELNDSKKKLEDIIQKQVINFSYPYGDYNNTTREIANSLYEIITTSNIGINKIGCDKKKLKRIEIIASDTENELNKKVNGYYDYLNLRSIFD